MRKSFVPLAIGIALLAGCATVDSLNALQKTVQDNGVVLVRSMTMLNQPHVFLTWVRPNGDRVTSITRWKAGAQEASVPPPASASGTTGAVEDTQSPALAIDTDYSYDVQFKTGSKISRSIRPISALSGAAVLVSPVSPVSLPPSVAKFDPATLVLQWRKLSATVDATKGIAYMVTLAKLSFDPLHLPTSFSPDTADVKYSALIDGNASAKYLKGDTFEVPYGTKSDVPLASELLSALSGNDTFKAIAPKDAVALTAGEYYVWTVTPFVYNTDQTAFALGSMATPAFFQVN